MLTKRQLKEFWKETDFRPLKKLGQNFLIDKNIFDKISAILDQGVKKKDPVIEIGAGFGALTFLLSGLAGSVFAVEKDKKIIESLKKRMGLPDNVTLIEGDFLKLDIEKIAGGDKLIVYGNIPYYITSPILEKLFENSRHIKTIYLVVQEEMAARILSGPGSRGIGRLSLFVQYYANPKKIFKIKKESFFPVPEVDSVFLQLDMREKRRPEVKNEALFFDIIRKAYSQRRKTLLNSLSELKKDKKELLALLIKCGVNPTARAEKLTLEDFGRIANTLLD